MPALFNKIIKILIASDFFLNLGWGLLSPIFAIFILESITAGNSAKAVEVAGFSALFYWITKSIFEIPIGWYLDKKYGEKDDFWFMVIGTFITALVPVGYIFSSVPWHIYFFQVIHAAGMAMALPSWLAIFTRHIDKGKEAFEWSIEATSIGAGAGIAGGIGGLIAASFGFKAVFVFAAILNVLSAILLIFIKDSIYPKTKEGGAMHIEKPVVGP